MFFPFSDTKTDNDIGINKLSKNVFINLNITDNQSKSSKYIDIFSSKNTKKVHFYVLLSYILSFSCVKFMFRRNCM